MSASDPKQTFVQRQWADIDSENAGSFKLTLYTRSKEEPKSMNHRWHVASITRMIFTAALATCAWHARSAPVEKAGVVVALKRTGCLGSCPAYKVTVRGDGRVQFTTDTGPRDAHRRVSPWDGVLVPGTHEAMVAPEVVAALVKQFEAADFWRLKHEYRLMAVDAPMYVVSLRVGSRTKSVIDDQGTEVGMPQAVRDLEDAIDQVAGTDRWITGNADLISWLEQSGFNFRSAEAAEIVAAGEGQRAPESTVLALIDRGAPLDHPVSTRYPGPPQTEMAGVALIRYSMERVHLEVFKRLVKDGWLDRAGKANVAELFAESAGGCSPAMVDAVADAGINIDAAMSISSGDSPQAKGRTALAELIQACNGDEAKPVQTATRLLAHGADPNHRDSLGRTPLYGVDDLELLNFLLAHGADARAKSLDGGSLVFGSWGEDVVLRLLEAGASPAGTDTWGSTLAELAKARNMSRVARWLAAHPEAYMR